MTILITLNRRDVSKVKKASRKTKQHTYTFADFYEEYKHQCKIIYGDGYQDKLIPYKVWKNMGKRYFELLTSMMLKSREAYKMPKKLGTLYVKKGPCNFSTPERSLKLINKIEDPKEKQKALHLFMNYQRKNKWFYWHFRAASYGNANNNVKLYNFKPSVNIIGMLNDEIYRASLNPKEPDFYFETGSKPNHTPINLPAV